MDPVAIHDVIPKNDLSLGDISKMKVADLKQELKLRGLPLMGNKSELIERLQTSLLGSNKDFDASEPSDDVNEDDVLADDSLLNDEGKLLEEDLLGKDVDVLTAEVLKPKLIEKPRIALTRSTVIASSLPPAQSSSVEPTDTKSKVSITSVKSESESDKVSPTKPTMSEEERRVLRAKRFNITSEETKLKTRSDRFGIVNKVIANSATSVKTTTKEDVDILKKRADRFGQNVSTLMKQIESKDKMLKRKERFGTVIPSVVGVSGNEQDKKKLRGQRFGVS